jgi:hypothetical protein
MGCRQQQQAGLQQQAGTCTASICCCCAAATLPSFVSAAWLPCSSDMTAAACLLASCSAASRTAFAESACAVDRVPSHLLARPPPCTARLAADAAGLQRVQHGWILINGECCGHRSHMQVCIHTCALRALFRSPRRSSIRVRSCFTSPSMRCCRESRRARSSSALLCDHAQSRIVSLPCEPRAVAIQYSRSSIMLSCVQRPTAPVLTVVHTHTWVHRPFAGAGRGCTPPRWRAACYRTAQCCAA